MRAGIRPTTRQRDDANLPFDEWVTSAGYRRSLDNGDVWGHFINVVAFSASGASSDDLCNFDDVGTCIIGLVE